MNAANPQDSHAADALIDAEDKSGSRSESMGRDA